jgi:2-Cys peroxiredoxin 5
MSNSIFTTRTLGSVANRVGLIQRSLFHSTIPVPVRVGDSIPDTDVLVEGSPGNKINLAKEIKGKKALIIGVPAAFSE